MNAKEFLGGLLSLACRSRLSKQSAIEARSVATQFSAAIATTAFNAFRASLLAQIVAFVTDRWDAIAADEMPVAIATSETVVTKWHG